MAFDILWMNVAAVFAFVNVAFVIILLGLYFQSWRKIRSSISISLMTFSFFFLIQNLVIIIFWLVLYSLAPQSSVLEGVVIAAAPYLVAINALESLALGNLVRLAWS